MNEDEAVCLAIDDWAEDISGVAGGLVYGALGDGDGADVTESGVCEHDVEAFCGLVPEYGDHCVVDILGRVDGGGDD